MGLSVGIVGLPNVGKSTTFNALTKAQNAQSANYPFCTIEPNKAKVPVPDSRLAKLAEIVKPERICPSVVEFVDIAGLVRGASKGEGLGNQFLANIKECDLILHLVRCFEDDNITHIEGRVNPLSDIETIEIELILADLQTLEKRIERLNRAAKASKDAAKALEIALQLKSHLESSLPARTFPQKNTPDFALLERELRFLSNKEVVFGANVDENFTPTHLVPLHEHAKKCGCEVVAISAKLEEEMIGMSEEERAEFLAEMGAAEGGLAQIIRVSFEKLNLISYFTAGVKEVRSWTIPRGASAPQAAGVIHNDFEKGFIRAEIIAFEDFIKHRGEAGAKEAGLMRIEGRDYVMKDGDVAHFRFNV